MTNPYEDIIHLPRPVSSGRRHMTISERAAQFAPFAALSGFSSAIEEAGQHSITTEESFQKFSKEN